MERVPFGTLEDGTQASLMTLRAPGIEVDVSDFGASIVALRVPDRSGEMADVALGFSSAAEYQARSGCHGATIGRYAGRIANGRFPLHGGTVQLERNRGQHTIHGGPVGFHKRLWRVCAQEENRLELELFSPDGDQGFPGNVTVRAVFSVAECALTLELFAVSDADTPFNMTNHVYWNLGGHNSGTVDDHVLSVPAEFFLETDEEIIPSGRILPLEHTTLDLRTSVSVAAVHADHTLLLPPDGELRQMGYLAHPASGRWMKVYSNLPAVQVYTADHMVVVSGKGGAVYGPRRGMCLEAQNCPDAPNHADFPPAILHAGENQHDRIRWQFGTDASFAKKNEKI